MNNTPMSDDLTEEERQDIKRHHAEREQIHQAMLMILHAWANIEGCLVHLLAEFTKEDLSGGAPIAGTILGTINSFDTQLNIVNRLLAPRLDHVKLTYRLKSGKFGEVRLNQLWKSLCKQLHEKKFIRNLVAHGIIVSTSENGKSEPRLSSTFYVKRAPYPEQRKYERNAAEMDNDLKATSRLLNKVIAITDYLAYRRAAQPGVPSPEQSKERVRVERRLIVNFSDSIKEEDILDTM